MRKDQDCYDEAAELIRNNKRTRTSGSNSGATNIIIIDGNNHGTININPPKENRQEHESALTSAAKFQLTDALQELHQLVTTLRELVTQLRRLSPFSTWTKHIKNVIYKVEEATANHLSTAPILASSICRALFFDPPPLIPQPIDLCPDSTQYRPIPPDPAFLNLNVAAQ